MFVTLNFARVRDNQNAVTSIKYFIPLPEDFFILQRYDIPTIWYEKKYVLFLKNYFLWWDCL